MLVLFSHLTACVGETSNTFEGASLSSSSPNENAGEDSLRPDGGSSGEYGGSTDAGWDAPTVIVDVGWDDGPPGVSDEHDGVLDSSDVPAEGFTDDDGEHDASSDAEAGSDTGDDPFEAPDHRENPGPHVRFVVFGDWGISDTSAIERGADAMRAVCLAQGCDFAASVGDNFYPAGVSDVEDPDWETKWQGPFAEWDIPFYMTLGNHDRDGNAQAQVDYSDIDDRWVMPAFTYDVIAGPIHLFAMDTDVMNADQGSWLAESVRSAEEPWTVAFGHHTWLSNGSHGDSRGTLRQVQEWAFCGRLDLYLCGHDHNLELVEPECGVDIAVSGNLTQHRSLTPGPNTVFSFTDHGFVWVDASPLMLALEFHDVDGNLLFRQERAFEADVHDCSLDGTCDSECESDTDCYAVACVDDGVCEPQCTDDPNCFLACPCDFNRGICEPIAQDTTQRCACDPLCWGGKQPCQSDGHCDTWCPAAPADPDCL